MANFILFDNISCSKAQSEFSAYLDGAISGRDMQSIASHLKSCADCTAEFAAWQSTQRAISSLGALKAPEDLGLRLRLAISREKAKQASHWTDRFSLQWHNVLGPLALQASAGLAAAVLLVGGMITMLGVAPSAVLADDEPLGAVTAPHYRYSLGGFTPIQASEDGVIIVAAEINASGVVYDYQILTGPVDDNVRKQLEQHLLTSVYTPASAFGVPTRGRTLVTFSGISVKG